MKDFIGVSQLPAYRSYTLFYSWHSHVWLVNNCIRHKGSKSLNLESLGCNPMRKWCPKTVPVPQLAGPWAKWSFEEPGKERYDWEGSQWEQRTQHTQREQQRPEEGADFQSCPEVLTTFQSHRTRVSHNSLSFLELTWMALCFLKPDDQWSKFLGLYHANFENKNRLRLIILTIKKMYLGNDWI